MKILTPYITGMIWPCDREAHVDAMGESQLPDESPDDAQSIHEEFLYGPICLRTAGFKKSSIKAASAMTYAACVRQVQPAGEFWIAARQA